MSLNSKIEPKKNYQVKTKNRIQNKPNNIGIEFFLNLDLNKLKELNNKTAELIFEEKADEGLIILKKLELCLESNVIEPKIDFDKKLLVIILHNIACCHQKLQEINNCISYLEAVIYHYDLSLENKHNININENFFLYHLKENKDNYQLLGDLILELRFSAKFHLQMSDLLSQANRHIEGLKHAKLASVICEDNIIKTNHLYSQIRDKQIKNSILFNKNINNNNINIGDENSLLNDKIKLNYKIINELYDIILNLRDFDAKPKYSSFSNKILNYKNEYNIEYNKNKKNSFNSYVNYREFEIKNFKSKNSLINKIRYIFGGTIKQDDWIQLLNIDNILFLSPLNCEDLDLDSDSRYELLRDTILEKIVMLTVSYFCLAREMKFLAEDKNNKKINGEYYLFQAIELCSMFLPVSCPILKFYISTYYKNYGQDMDIIPEGKIINMNINLVRDEIEENKDILSFVRLKKMSYVNKTQNNMNKSIDYSNNNTIFKNLNNILIPHLNIKNNANNSINKVNLNHKLMNCIETNISNNTSNMNSNTHTNLNTNLNTNTNINTNLNTNSNSNSNRKANSRQISKNEKTVKSCEKIKRNKTKKMKKNKSKPLSSYSVQISKSTNSNKGLTNINSYNSNAKKFKSKSNSTNKKDSDIKTKFNNVMKINLKIKNLDILPNKNFINFSKKSKIDEKLAPKFKLNFKKLNKSDNNSDEENNEINRNANINSMNNLLPKFSNIKSNTSSKKNNDISNGKNKKTKLNKKAFSINLNSNFCLNGNELKTERLKNPKINLDQNLYKKSNINERNRKNFDKKIISNLSPKYNYTSILLKKKELSGNQTDRLSTKKKINIKKNNFSIKINDIKIKFNSPQGKKSISKTYRYFGHEKTRSKKEQNIFGNSNNSFKNKMVNKNDNFQSMRNQYVNYHQKTNNSKSYYTNNLTNNSNNSCTKDLSIIKSMEIFNKFFLKNKKNFSFENNAFQRPFKNKINLNKHHLNENLMTHFKNINS